MEHTQEIYTEALVLLNQCLAEFRSGDMTKYEEGAESDNIEILFSEADEGLPNFNVDIYLIEDEFHEDQIAGFVCEDFSYFLSIDKKPYQSCSES
jgi:hypothetical protein